MSIHFEPKGDRGENSDTYDSLASLLVYYIKENIKDMDKSVEQRLKALDEMWAKQGEP